MTTTGQNYPGHWPVYNYRTGLSVPPFRSRVGGIPARNSKGERLLLFIGIIDILQSYRWASLLCPALPGSLGFDLLAVGARVLCTNVPTSCITISFLFQHWSAFWITLSPEYVWLSFCSFFRLVCVRVCFCVYWLFSYPGWRRSWNTAGKPWSTTGQVSLSLSWVLSCSAPFTSFVVLARHSIYT